MFTRIARTVAKGGKMLQSLGSQLFSATNAVLFIMLKDLNDNEDSVFREPLVLAFVSVALAATFRKTQRTQLPAMDRQMDKFELKTLCASGPKSINCSDNYCAFDCNSGANLFSLMPKVLARCSAVFVFANTFFFGFKLIDFFTHPFGLVLKPEEDRTVLIVESTFVLLLINLPNLINYFGMQIQKADKNSDELALKLKFIRYDMLLISELPNEPTFKNKFVLTQKEAKLYQFTNYGHKIEIKDDFQAILRELELTRFLTVKLNNKSVSIKKLFLNAGGNRYLPLFVFDKHMRNVLFILFPYGVSIFYNSLFTTSASLKRISEIFSLNIAEAIIDKLALLSTTSAVGIGIMSAIGQLYRHLAGKQDPIRRFDSVNISNNLENIGYGTVANCASMAYKIKDHWGIPVYSLESFAICVPFALLGSVVQKVFNEDAYLDNLRHERARRDGYSLVEDQYEVERNDEEANRQFSALVSQIENQVQVTIENPVQETKIDYQPLVTNDFDRTTYLSNLKPARAVDERSLELTSPRRPSVQVKGTLFIPVKETVLEQKTPLLTQAL